jgi:hypothetical protein
MMVGGDGGKSARSPAQSITKQLKLISNSKLKLHKKVNSMIVDNYRDLLYSTGEEKLIHTLCLKSKKTYGFMKCSNCQPTQLEIAESTQRLYCATKEGLVLILNISKPNPVMIHAIRLVQQLNP